MALVIGGILAYLFLPWPWWLVVVIALAGVEVFEAALWLSLRRRRPIAGHEALVGQPGVLVAPGRVRIRGTTYPARAQGAEVGDAVEVASVEGMTLVVRRPQVV